MSNHPTIAALRAALESERDYLNSLTLTKGGPEHTYINRFNAGYESATERLMSVVEELYTALYVSNEALLWCEEMLKARDEMNSKVHCAPVRLSPITERVIKAREFLAELEKELK